MAQRMVLQEAPRSQNEDGWVVPVGHGDGMPWRWQEGWEARPEGDMA
jgi:hypothetical protein